MPTISRRLVMKSLVGLLGAAVARPALAASGAPRKMIFVFANGGWDPLSVFAPIFDSPYVDPHEGGEPAVAGGLRYVDHADRPSVRAFFERWHAQTAILNGISVPSLSHEVCTKLMWTGQAGEGRPDWPSTVAAAQASGFTLPSLVLSGPSFPEANGIYSARAGNNGQLADLVDGSILDVRDRRQDNPLPEPLRRLVSDRVEQRAKAFGGRDPLAKAFRTSLERARALSEASDPLDFRAINDMGDRIQLAVDALGRGVCRVVTLETDDLWDTHNNNDINQSFMFESLFFWLDDLMDRLASRPGTEGSLLDETTVVVLSEMGRTPKFNDQAGRDHWPYTSALMMGAGVRGDQVISGYDDGYYPLGYDAATGATTPGGNPLTTEHLGATLLALADVDPRSALPAEISPIQAVLT